MQVSVRNRRKPAPLLVLSLLMITGFARASHIALPPPSLTFIPVGAQLDGDAIDDIVTTPGAVLTFMTQFDTLTAIAPVIGVVYDILWDPVELALAGVPTDRPANPFTTSDSVIRPNRISITHTGGSFPAGLVAALDQIQFTVLPRLNPWPGDGFSDLRIANVEPLFRGIIPGPITVNRVEVQAIPEPSTVTLVGLGLLCLLVRCSRQRSHGEA